MGQRTKDYEKKKWGFVRIIGSLLLAFGFVGLIQHEGIIGFVLASGIGIFGMVMIYYSQKKIRKIKAIKS